jgi:ketosteroid isomerase-like protein
MSANEDLVRSIYADWERGDFSRTAWADPEVEYVVADGPAPGRWSGLAGMAEAWRGILSAWDGLHVLPEEYRDLDAERVRVLLDNTGRGKTSGVNLDEMRGGANLFHVRNGKVTRYVMYWNRDRALADLGLEE